MEPDWTKQIPNGLICDTYYAFFIVYAVIFVFALINGAITMFYMKGLNPMVKLGLFLLNGILSAIVVTMMLFMYLMCDRSLLAPRVVAPPKAEGFYSASRLPPPPKGAKSIPVPVRR